MTEEELVEYQRTHKRVTEQVWADMDALARRLVLPGGPESPDLLALRRMHRVTVAVPQPGDPRREVYGPSEENVTALLMGRDFTKAELRTAAELRGVTHIRADVTKAELVKALVFMGQAWFGEAPPDDDPDDDYGDEPYDEEDRHDDHDPDDVAALVAHDANVNLFLL